jgi:DNA repair protein RecO (recombination protein O)
MEEKSIGLILRTRPLTETSLIVQWLTPEFGRLATVAKGARRPKSPFRGKLDLFFVADFSFARSRRSELHLLREVSVRETNPALRHDLDLLQQASYAAALIEQTTETETPLPALFQLLLDLLRFLPGRPARPQTIFALEIKLLEELGLQPDLAKARLSEGARMGLKRLHESDWETGSRLTLSAAQIRELNEFLRNTLLFQVGKVLPGRRMALAIE